MRNLFDGHPDLFVVPFESHFFQSIKYWVSYYFRRTQPENLSLDEMKKGLYDWIVESQETEHLIADGFTKGMWNLKAVEDLMAQTKVTNLRELSDLYVKCIYKGLKNDNYPENAQFVEKSVENAEFAQEILRIYPGARFIHILRNPYSNLVAIRNYSAIQQTGKKGRYPRLRSAIWSMHGSYHDLYRNKRLISNYHILRYEDLLMNPVESMKEISKFLDIEYKPLLTQPSMLGEPWGGNSTSGKKFAVVSSENVDRWRKEITPIEVWLINRLFPFVLRDFEFKRLPSKGFPLAPSKGEGPTNYLYNRLLRFFFPS
jgi:hypothetical protein